MSDKVRALATSLRQSAVECRADYEQLVEASKALTSIDGAITNFATVYIASRLVHNGYADAFIGTDYWHNAWFADHLQDFIEAEIVKGTKPPDGQFTLDLAFLVLSQVEWQGVAPVLSGIIAQQQEAMLRLKGKDIPDIESRSMSPDEWRKLTGQE